MKSSQYRRLSPPRRLAVISTESAPTAVRPKRTGAHGCRPLPRSSNRSPPPHPVTLDVPSSPEPAPSATKISSATCLTTLSFWSTKPTAAVYCRPPANTTWAPRRAPWRLSITLVRSPTSLRRSPPQDGTTPMLRHPVNLSHLTTISAKICFKLRKRL